MLSLVRSSASPVIATRIPDGEIQRILIPDEEVRKENQEALKEMQEILRRYPNPPTDREIATMNKTRQEKTKFDKLASFLEMQQRDEEN